MKTLKPLRHKAPPKKIVSKRIYLQKHDLKLAPLMFSYVEKDRARLEKFLPWVPFIKSAKDEAKFIKSMDKAWGAFSDFDYGIFRKADRLYVGNIGVHSISWKNHVAEIGYWILGDFEGQGYMTEAVRALEGALFKVGFNRVQIRCSTLNARSANVPRACGYTYEGTIRQDALDRGTFRDTLVFSKLKSER